MGGAGGDEQADHGEDDDHRVEGEDVGDPERETQDYREDPRPGTTLAMQPRGGLSLRRTIGRRYLHAC